jgi:hypothetical protein
MIVGSNLGPGVMFYTLIGTVQICQWELTMHELLLLVVEEKMYLNIL